MKKILYNTDFSDCAINAFSYALHLANQFNAELITLHTYTRPIVGSMYLPNTYQNIYEHLQTDEFDMFKDAAKLLHIIAEKEKLEHIKNTFIMLEERPIDGMLKTIEKEGVDLVIMGTKGASGLKEAFIGSVTSKLMEKSPCPVLAIPNESNYGEGLKNILFTSDFFPKEIASLKYALDLSDNLNAHFECINTATDYSDYKDKLINDWTDKLQFTKYNDVNFSIIDAHTLNDISNYINEHQIDLLITTIYDNNFIEELFHYSLAKRLAHHATIPILTIPSTKKCEAI
jgi:nucleotide-binding universal stress UspA family protein